MPEQTRGERNEKSKGSLSPSSRAHSDSSASAFSTVKRDEKVRVKPVNKVGREKVLFEAVSLAREALRDLTRDDNVGEHAGVVVESDRILTHAFRCLLPGYTGWLWTVTLARAPRSSRVTVNEVALRPGPDALLAPEWVPWAERLRPSDVAPTDRLPFRANDPRLDQGFESTGMDADQLEMYELGIGRARVLSAYGRDSAFKRWYEGEAGPNNPGTRQARAVCADCGFLMRMAGSARALFGVCANEWSAFDGKVVSLDHGCGSHSETDVNEQAKMWEPVAPVVDESGLEIVAPLSS